MSASKTDLSAYNNSWYKPGRPLPVRLLWYLVNSVYFNSSFPFYAPKRMLLRLFGAKIGKGFIIKPYVSIKYPWKLEVGDYVWVGEKVWIDNLAKVTLKNNSCISQGALILCGNHNYRKSTFDLITEEIIFEEGAWAGARTVICPGVKLGSHSMLTAGSVAVRSLEPYYVYQGNPAVKVKEREILP
jgi:putative colanic acid biosynthesis acetyltransferase WcaF